jgi:hypothetical protein
LVMFVKVVYGIMAHDSIARYITMPYSIRRKLTDKIRAVCASHQVTPVFAHEGLPSFQNGERVLFVSGDLQEMAVSYSGTVIGDTEPSMRVVSVRIGVENHTEPYVLGKIAEIFAHPDLGWV